MSETIYVVLVAICGVAIVVGSVGRLYFRYRAMVLRSELWRREDARRAGTVPYDADGYEDWSLPIPTVRNVRRGVERRERPR